MNTTSSIHQSPVSHQFIYTDDDNRTWAADCYCNEIVAIDDSGHYLNSAGEEVPHVIVENPTRTVETSDWYEISMNSEGGEEYGVIQIKLQTEAGQTNASSSSHGSARSHSGPLSLDTLNTFEETYSHSPTRLSDEQRPWQGKPQPLTLHNWTIKQPRNFKEYQLMNALIHDPNSHLCCPPKEPYIIHEKIEHHSDFESLSDPLESIQTPSFFSQLYEEKLSSFFDNYPKNQPVLKNAFAYLAHQYATGKLSYLRYVNQIANFSGQTNFSEILEDLCSDLLFHEKIVKKTRVCLGHEIYRIECKNRRDLQKQSDKQVNFYENNPNVKHLKTNHIERNRGKKDRHPFIMLQYLTCVDNYLGCNHYKIESHLVSDLTYPNCGLDLIKESSPQSFSQMAKTLLYHSTNFNLVTSSLDEEADLTISWQKAAEQAIECGCYKEAIEILTQNILSPSSSPSSYLDRSAAYFGLGNYEESVQDFKKFQESFELEGQSPNLEIAQSFSESLVSGVKDSLSGICTLFYDLVKHPVYTTTELCKSVSQLVTLTKNQEWSLLAETLVPEAYELISKWDSLSNQSKGHLLGYMIGKYGADIIVPGTLFKVASKSLSKARQLNQIYSGLKRSERLLLLESMTALESATEIKHVVQANQRIIAAGNELNLSVREMYHLKEAGKLNGSLHSVYENMFPSVMAKESFELFQKAEKYLKPYRNKVMPEVEIRDLIKNAGIKVCPRPAGIPENFQVCISKKGAGIVYVNPNYPQETIRLMPGKLHSEMPYQQQPYIVHRIGDKALNTMGEPVNKKSPGAHIPINQYHYKNLN